MARFFFAMEQLQHDIEQRLAGSEPDVEVLLVERSGERLRIFIDHPSGVTLDLCERVTEALGDLREQYGLEVSSPGPKRPLTKPEHFRRFVGRRARVRTEPGSAFAGRDTLTGELIGASPQEVTLGLPEGVVAIPYAAIRRSHLVEE
ncbi:MAG TPA: ribosome maturation factor RimP [Solirubrobacteraceae bacterium]|nr:ribosome maturation factor RimP [Solirubrobacteraceae bacterium]